MWIFPLLQMTSKHVIWMKNLKVLLLAIPSIHLNIIFFNNQTCFSSVRVWRDIWNLYSTWTPIGSCLFIRIPAKGCWAVGCPRWRASDVFMCSDIEGGQAECTQALFPGRVQYQERLSSQGHLCPVRIPVSSSALEGQTGISLLLVNNKTAHVQSLLYIPCIHLVKLLLTFFSQVIWMAGNLHQQQHMCW